MNSSDRLLAAFRSECMEHLEAVRSYFAAVASQKEAPNDTALTEIFRRAHSLKGAARIVGAHGVEQIAHRLETLFAKLRSKDIGSERETICVVQLALDSIEDLASSTSPSDAASFLTPVLEELDRINATSRVDQECDASPATFQDRLQAAFDEDCREYLRSLWDFVKRAKEPVDAGATTGVEEAFHCSHNLRAAARVAGVAAVESIGARLEETFSRLLREPWALEGSTIDGIVSDLQAIEQCIAAPTHTQRRTSSTPAPFMENVAGNSVSEAADGSANASPGLASSPDTVRVSLDSLDCLLRSTGELLSESLNQDLLFAEMNAMNRQIAQITQEWNSFRKMAANATSPGCFDDDVRRRLDRVDHGLHSLSRQARSARLLQQRNAWSLRLLGNQLQRDARAIRTVSTESVFQGFRKMVRDLARDEGKQIEFKVSGFDVQADRMVLQALKDPLMHVLRNAVTHGIERPDQRQNGGKPPTGVVELKIESAGNCLLIDVEDDGRGLDLAKIAEVASDKQLYSGDFTPPDSQYLSGLLFQPGFSTADDITELSGRGLGLAVAHDAVAKLQGSVHVRPGSKSGTVFSLRVPLAISTHRVLLVESQQHAFAIPLSGIESLHRISVDAVATVEGRPTITVDGNLLYLTPLAALLGIDDGNPAHDMLSVVVIRAGETQAALVVDKLLSEREALIKNLGSSRAIPTTFSGGILLEDGAVALVINPTELVHKQSGLQSPIQRQPTLSTATKASQTILVVDDSFTTRTLETSILESHGYQVRVAVDGLEALAHLREEEVDLIITDIQMPRLDGFGLIEELKKEPRWAHLPVIIVSSVERREDQQRGLSLGADAYIVKRKFDHHDLLQTIKQIL